MRRSRHFRLYLALNVGEVLLRFGCFCGGSAARHMICVVDSDSPPARSFTSSSSCSESFDFRDYCTIFLWAFLSGRFSFLFYLQSLQFGATQGPALERTHTHTHTLAHSLTLANAAAQQTILAKRNNNLHPATGKVIDNLFVKRNEKSAGGPVLHSVALLRRCKHCLTGLSSHCRYR